MAKISDERLAGMLTHAEAATETYLYERSADQLAILTELQSLRSQPAGVRVKGLEWRVAKNGDMHANTEVGQYAIGKVAGYIIVVLRRITRGIEDDADLKSYNSIDEAKAAAQADYRQRILSALEPHQEEAVAFEETGEYGRFAPITTPVQKVQESQTMSVTEEMVERACHARVPGGSEVWHWIHGGGMEVTDLHRSVVRTLLEALEPSHVTE